MRSRLLLLLLAVSGLPGYALIQIGDDGPNLRWTRGFEVPMHIDSRGHPTLPFGDVRGALERGLSSWHQPDTTLRFVRDPNGRDGDSPAMDGVNLVRFERNALPPEVDPSHTLAFTSPVSGACTGVLFEADITFNAVDTRWSAQGQPGNRTFDIESVMLHEAGHLLGLDHTGDQRAIMFPTIGPRELKRTPQNDDLQGLRAVYGQAVGRLDCTSDFACDGDEVCLYSVRSDDSFGTFCGPAVGRGAPGAACNGDQPICDNGCANGLCLSDDVCSAICLTDRECPRGQTCLPQDTGGGEFVNFCLQLDLCEADLDGCDRGEACGIVPHPQDPTLIYLCIEAGDGVDGDPCRVATDCRGGVCDLGSCSRLCGGDGDCADGSLCTAIDVPLPGGRTAGAQVCRASNIPCTRPRDCAVDEACVYQRINGRTEGRCLPARGTPAGGACARPSDCSSQLCLPNGVCSDPCFQDRDCPQGMTCGRVDFQGNDLAGCVGSPEGPEPDQGPPPADAGPAPDRGVSPDQGGGPDAGGPEDAGRRPDRGGTPWLVDQGADAQVPQVIERGGGGGGQGPFGCAAPPGAPRLPGWPTLFGLLALGVAYRRR